MTEPAGPGSTRPEKPQYGEYATPEEVAAARGPLPAPRPDPVPNATIAAPPPTGARVAARDPLQTNNIVTVLLLVFGIWNTVTSIPSYLDLGSVLSQGLATLGYGSFSFGNAAHVGGIVLLVISVLVLLAAVGVSLRLIRLHRRSVWVPIVAGALFAVATFVVMTVVVANTPALVDVLHNH